jgi:hypothetical protein
VSPRCNMVVCFFLKLPNQIIYFLVISFRKGMIYRQGSDGSQDIMPNPPPRWTEYISRRHIIILHRRCRARETAAPHLSVAGAEGNSSTL